MKTFSKALMALGVAAMAAATVIPTSAALAAPPRFQDHGNYATYGNYRGDRDRHPGYQQYNGYWFPPGAFIAGAIVGGILGSAANSAPTYAYAGSPHVTWCEQNYRSYNVATDSFNGYDGYSHRCVSPYDYPQG